MSESPNELAYAARAEQRQDVLDYVVSRNARLKSQYAEDVLQWVVNKQQGGPPRPIPDPPLGIKAIDHTNTESEAAYDARYPGIPPMLDDVTGDPVCPKYIEPEDHTPHGAIIGAAIIGMPGWYAAGYRDGSTRYDDQTPGGTEVDGTSRDGVTGRFRKISGAVGPGWWVKIA